MMWLPATGCCVVWASIKLIYMWRVNVFCPHIQHSKISINFILCCVFRIFKIINSSEILLIRWKDEDVRTHRASTPFDEDVSLKFTSCQFNFLCPIWHNFPDGVFCMISLGFFWKLISIFEMLCSDESRYFAGMCENAVRCFKI